MQKNNKNIIVCVLVLIYLFLSPSLSFSSLMAHSLMRVIYFAVAHSLSLDRWAQGGEVNLTSPPLSPRVSLFEKSISHEKSGTQEQDSSLAI